MRISNLKGYVCVFISNFWELVMTIGVPQHIEEVLGAQVAFGKYQIAEVTTINVWGEPRTFPVYTSYAKERRKIIFLTSIAYTRKVRNIRNNPRVSLLFSNTAFSCLRKLPIILVQGKAKAFDPEPSVLNNLRQQSEERLQKWDWRMLTVRIEVDIEKIYVWKNRNVDEEPQVIEVGHDG